MSARPPVTTPAGVLIGNAFRQPQRPAALDQDAKRLQDALLEPRTAAPQPLIQRLAGAIWRWL